MMRLISCASPSAPDLIASFRLDLQARREVVTPPQKDDKLIGLARFPAGDLGADSGLDRRSRSSATRSNAAGAWACDRSPIGRACRPWTASWVACLACFRRDHRPEFSAKLTTMVLDRGDSRWSAASSPKPRAFLHFSYSYALPRRPA